MLLANIYTAEKTRIEFPHSAVLRRHPRPPETNFHPLLKVAENKVSCCGLVFGFRFHSTLPLPLPSPPLLLLMLLPSSSSLW